MQTKAIQHLSQDPIMRELVARFDPPVWSESEDLYAAIVETVTGQQLSVRAADAIFTRLCALFPDNKISPDAVLSCSEGNLRDAGLSNAKVRSIREIAAGVKNREIDLEALRTLSDESLIAELVKLRGIGPWTAEMILIFDLGRRDVFSVGDLGLRNAVSQLYGIDRDNRNAILALAEKWSPFRSYACHYLWMSLDNTPRDESAG